MNLATNLVSVAIGLTVVTAVVAKAASAPVPPPRHAASAAERATIASSIAAYEAEWRASSAESFPSDAWSQRDSFQGHEAKAVRPLAQSAGVSLAEAFRVIDADVHRTRGADRSADVVPCKPRPVFE